MKFIIAVLITLTTTLASAQDSATGGWKWGIGFDNTANFKSGVTLDILSPKLFGETNEYSLVLSVSSQQLNYNILNEDLDVIPVRLLLEARNPLYKEIVSTYVRLGAGYAFASDVFIHKDDGYFIVPFVIGADFIHAERNGHHASFFAQASFDMNFEKPSDGLANDLDGTTISIGLRIFY